MSFLGKVIPLLLLGGFWSPISYSADIHINNLEISKIRAVGNYKVADTYDNTIELWFTTSLTIPSNMNCSATYRVYVDAKNTHIVSAAYLAFSSGKKVNIQIDDLLPIRSSACEVSYLDVLK